MFLEAVVRYELDVEIAGFMEDPYWDVISRDLVGLEIWMLGASSPASHMSFVAGAWSKNPRCHAQPYKASFQPKLRSHKYPLNLRTHGSSQGGLHGSLSSIQP